MVPLKEKLNELACEQIAWSLVRVQPKFNPHLFINQAKQTIEFLELKQRVRALSELIVQQIEPNSKNILSLTKALKQNPQDQVGLEGFLVWPLTEYIATYGLSHWDSSLAALKTMTPLFTAEFAIRSFFLKDPKRMIEIFQSWVNDTNPHVRRLVSEGSRPLLPWAPKLPLFLADPNWTTPLLVALKNDTSKYVNTSVANHFNDLSKQHPQWVVKQLKHWPNDWVVKKALRTLIKAGYPPALNLIGASEVPVKTSQLKLLTPQIKLGEMVMGQVTLTNLSPKAAKFIVDVEIYLLKANQTLRPKVFKGITLTIPANKSQLIQLKTPLRKVTTRTYYPGQHYWALKINGKKTTKKVFQLSVD